MASVIGCNGKEVTLFEHKHDLGIAEERKNFAIAVIVLSGCLAEESRYPPAKQVRNTI